MPFDNLEAPPHLLFRWFQVGSSFQSEVVCVSEGHGVKKRIKGGNVDGGRGARNT